MSGVKAPPLDPAAFAARFAETGAAAGFRVEQYGRAAGVPLFALTRRRSGVRPRIYLSSGIHGDEPAPVHAMLRMIESGLFDDRAVWFLCPLINPGGHPAGTRENPEGIDLNRDYLDLKSNEIQAHVSWLRRQPPFDLALCLHEDWEAKGFYVYELNPAGRPSLAPAMLKAVARHCPIDTSELIDGRQALGGVIRPAADLLDRATWPEAIYLRAHHTNLSYTLETPTAIPLNHRVAALSAAVEAAIGG